MNTTAIFNKNRIQDSLSHIGYKTLSTAQPAYLFSLLVALVRHLSSPSLVHPHLPLSKSQVALSDMHHPVFGIIFLPHSVNLVHRLSPPSHITSSLPFQNPYGVTHHPTHRTVHWTSTGLPSQTSYHSALCFSSSVIFF